MDCTVHGILQARKLEWVAFSFSRGSSQPRDLTQIISPNFIQLFFLLKGASWVSWGLVKGAEFTGKAIQKGASKLRERIQPEEKPVEVSPAVTKGLYMAKQATGGAAKVSQFLGKVTLDSFTTFYLH